MNSCTDERKHFSSAMHNIDRNPSSDVHPNFIMRRGNVKDDLPLRLSAGTVVVLKHPRGAEEAT